MLTPRVIETHRESAHNPALPTRAIYITFTRADGSTRTRKYHGPLDDAAQMIEAARRFRDRGGFVAYSAKFYR